MPRCILQIELQNSKLADEQHNTVKVVILEGDSLVEDLIDISSHDSKPIYFLSIIISEIKWNIVAIFETKW